MGELSVEDYDVSSQPAVEYEKGKCQLIRAADTAL